MWWVFALFKMFHAAPRAQINKALDINDLKTIVSLLTTWVCYEYTLCIFETEYEFRWCLKKYQKDWTVGHLILMVRLNRCWGRNAWNIRHFFPE